MEFSEKSKKLLTEMGWKENRSVSIEELKLPYDDYPDVALSFLKKYGNLEGNCEKQSYSAVVNTIHIYPEQDKEDLGGDSVYAYYESLLGRKLYPIGVYLPDGYHICCDFDGRVYKIGEYCFYVGKNLYEGIENILLMNTIQSFQLDEDTRKWWNRDGKHVELPPLE